MNDWTSPVDIRPDHLEMVQDILRELLPAGFQVWVFGSRANWTTKDSSDLDLAVEGPGKLEYKAMVGLEIAFEESDLPYTVDVVDLNAVSPDFKRIVEGQKVPLRAVGGQANGHCEWQKARLGEVIEFKRGYDLPQRNRIPGNTPVVSSSGITDWHSEAKVKGPGVVTGRYGTLGEIYFIPDDFWPLNTALYVRDFKGNDPRFISYFLRGIDFLAYSDKAAVPGLNRNHLHEEIVHYPTDIGEQRAIARVLGTLDDKIELNRRMNETLKAMARAVFRDWFVDFGPVRAKMEGREPYLSPELWDLFPDQLVYSELGEIPEGWEVKPLDEIASFLNGLALQKYPPDGGQSLPVIKIAQLRSGHTAGADRASTDVPPKYHVQDGDILLSWSGSLELDIWAGGEGALNQHLFKVDSEAYPKWLCYHWVGEHLTAFRGIAADKATTMGHIQRRHLSESATVVPDALMLKAMNNFMQPIFERRLSLRVANRTLAYQRDTLLPELISGNTPLGR